MEYTEIFEGIKIPAVLFKYRSFRKKRHRDLLSKREVYLASPNDFEDKKDCNLDEKIPQKEELFNYYLKHIPNHLQNEPQLKREEYARYMAKNGLCAHPKEAKERINQMNAVHNVRRGVLSLTKRWDNDYMWEHYGDNHCGFCVGFNTKALIETNYFGGGGEVLYYQELPQLDTDLPYEWNIFNNYFAKKNEFANEEEFRLIRSWDHTPINEERTLLIPSNCFECVIIGKNMNDLDKERIKDIHERYLPNSRLFELTDE